MEAHDFDINVAYNFGQARPQSKMTKSREQVLEVLYGLLKEATVDQRVDLNPEMAAETTLELLRLDSLDTLVLAMGLEDALDIEIRVVDLPKNRTISEIADYVAGLK
jgi:acyl carrier protein